MQPSQQHRRVSILDGDFCIRYDFLTSGEKLPEPQTVNPEDPQSKRLRRYQRHQLDRRVNVTSDQPGRGRIGGRCDTLGEGGFGASLAGELEIDETVTVELTHGPAGKRESITFRAVVRNKAGFHHGFAFVNISAVLRKQVKALMAEDSDKQ